MGILYLDEAGNTGLWDTDQTKLIYGGPYVSSSNWKAINADIAQIQHKYKSLILSRFQSGFSPLTTLQFLSKGITFLDQFHIHAKDIINRTGLWSKLDDNEKFQILHEVIDSLIARSIPVFVGILDKVPLRPTDGSRPSDLREYHKLLPDFLTFVDAALTEQEGYVVFLDDGNLPEKDAFRQVLNASQYKALGELVVEKSIKRPLLQAADVVVWIVQAFSRLDLSRSDHHATNIRTLHSKLHGILNVFTI